MVEVLRLVTEDQLKRIWALIHDAYVKAGYAKPQPNGMLRHYPNMDFIPETFAYGAFENEILMGTVSLTIDGPKGLSVDIEFKDLIDKIRAENPDKKIAALWRLTTTPNFNRSLSVLMAMIDQLHTTLVQEKVELILFVVNPKHEHFYQRVFGLKTISQVRQEQAVEAAPELLLFGDIKTLVDHWNEFKDR